ncbi:MAG: serine/threonine-protein kinase [Planctomycetota bacterium]|nr:serine/threonine-protein kinase [Planctomycetota bacterium]
MSGGKADGLIGHRLGGVRIDRLLAKGLLSDVYLGFNESLNRSVAVKILSPKVMAQGMSTERFMREGRALAQLSHANIVKIHNVGVESNRYFIVMDFIQDGANLRTLAKKHFLKPYQSLVVARRMAEALEYIHELGFIHRDIKPANICLRSNGQPILMDFSLIKDEGSDIQLTAPGTIMGTVNFMPPEQAQPGGPFGAVTPASDVYSLGATFYWLLTGNAPFKGRTPMETIIKLIRDPVIPPSQVNKSVPKEIDALCLKCLAKNPAERFKSARELIAAIDAVVQRKRAEIQAAQAPQATGDNDSGRMGARPPSARMPSPPPPPVSRGWGNKPATAAAPPPPPPAPQWAAPAQQTAQAAPPPAWSNQGAAAAQVAPPPPPQPMAAPPPPPSARMPAPPPQPMAPPPMAAPPAPMGTPPQPIPTGPIIAPPPPPSAPIAPPQPQQQIPVPPPAPPGTPPLELMPAASPPTPPPPAPVPPAPPAPEAATGKNPGRPTKGKKNREPRKPPKAKSSGKLLFFVGLVFLVGGVAAAAAVFYFMNNQ